MKKSISRLASLALAASLMAVSVAGCGGSKTSAGNSGSTTAAASGAETTAGGQTAPATPETEPVAASSTLGGKTLNIGYNVSIDSLTCFRSNTGRNAPYLLNLFESLAILSPASGKMEPWAAKSWETKDGGYTYSIEIWDMITDSEGNKITASDVVWYINTAMEKALMPNFSKVESVTKTGDYTFDVKLTTNIVGAFEALLFDTKIISESAFKASSDEFATKAVTTSAYECTEFTPGNSIGFTRRDDYWQTDIEALPECVRPLVKQLNYSIITEASQLGIALETGTVELGIDVDSTTGAQFVGNDQFVVNLTDGQQGWEMFFSGAESRVVAEDQNLRQAICYAIDAQGLITGLCSGYGTQMWDVCPPDRIGFLEKWKNEPYYEYDVEKAKELLAASNYNGETLTILCSSSTFVSRLAQMIQNYLAAVGIKAELYSVDMALLTSIRLDGTKYDMFLNTIGGTYLPDHWTIRYDPAAYETGDATSRHDYDLAELLYKTWTVDGFTEENIDEVHNYIKESAIAYGLVNPQSFTIWRNDAGLVKEVRGGLTNYVNPAACQFTE
ncbi:ABC transporter substrate-binding protein [Clostridium sp. MCC353]|uniref:ABC transporter substrate-binding protein n=1 Tax=Clostridium sp. MCC353 TaxID=2592646 RepID=UPI001C016079|nr:ABC transporter substrate-binding protein [Clostridium sp. MCC353]